MKNVERAKLPTKRKQHNNRNTNKRAFNHGKVYSSLYYLIKNTKKVRSSGRTLHLNVRKDDEQKHIKAVKIQNYKKRIILKRYKTFSVLIYSHINTSGIGKTRNCVETRRPQGGVFLLNFEFFQFPRVLI